MDFNKNFLQGILVRYQLHKSEEEDNKVFTIETRFKPKTITKTAQKDSAFSTRIEVNLK